MTREEAARLLEYHLKNEPTYIGLDDALRMAIAALNEVGSPTTQLDENGLMPCGCGGKASEYFVEHPYVDKGSYVECRWCRINVVGVNKQDARERWNTAMGYKEADE